MIKIEADMKRKKKIKVVPTDTNTDEVLRVINVLRQMIMENDDIMTDEAFMTIIQRFIEEDKNKENK